MKYKESGYDYLLEELDYLLEEIETKGLITFENACEVIKEAIEMSFAEGYLAVYEIEDTDDIRKNNVFNQVRELLYSHVIIPEEVSK